MIDYIQHILEIEEVKKEHDKLMIAKVTKYENEIAELKKELQEVKDDNKKLAKQIEDMRIDQGGWR
jgi:septal ring factor EnvC (AmiA/AmiB activator)